MVRLYQNTLLLVYSIHCILLYSLVFIITTNYFVNNYYLQKEAKGAKKKPITNVSTLVHVSLPML